MSTEEFDFGAALEATAQEISAGNVVEEAGEATPAVETPQTEEGEPQTPSESGETSATERTARAVPDTWKQEVRQHWDTLPDAVKDEILRREADIVNGFTQNKQDLDYAQTMRGVMQPYEPILAQYGIRPEAQVAALMNSHYTLVFGTPEQKMQLVEKIIRDYQIPLQLDDAAPEGEESSLFTDPAVKGLREKLGAVESTLSQMTTERVNEYRQAVHSQVEAFAKDPANKYFDEVANEMSSLIRAGMAKGVADAYQQAIYLNPVVRAKVQADEQAAKEAAAAEAAKARGEKVRKAAAVNVASLDHPAGGAASLGTMDDTMRETLKEIRSRS